MQSKKQNKRNQEREREREKMGSKEEGTASMSGDDSLRSFDFIACLEDAPHFRAALRRREQHIDTEKAKLEKIVKSCDEVLKKADAFEAAFSGLLENMRSLGDEDGIADSDDVGSDLFRTSVTRMCNTLQEVQASR